MASSTLVVGRWRQGGRATASCALEVGRWGQGGMATLCTRLVPLVEVRWGAGGYGLSALVVRKCGEGGAARSEADHSPLPSPMRSDLVERQR